MTVVAHSFAGLGTGISFVAGNPAIGLSCLNPSLGRKSFHSFKLRNRCFAQSSSGSLQPGAFVASYAERSHEIEQSQAADSAEIQALSCERDSRDVRLESSLPSPLHGGAEEVLGLSCLVTGLLLFPELSWAVDMQTAVTTTSTSQGLMAWASNEPANALSLPTWIIHVASVAEWVTAMALVWKYGDTPGKSAWKGLTWGMVPLLGGAMCACTWHFFYNAPSLEVLVVLQAFLTVAGNFTMWIAAYRIWQASQEKAPAK